MKYKNMIIRVTSATVFVLFIFSQIGWTMEPGEILRERFGKGLALQKELSEKGNGENPESKEALWKEFFPVFDVEEMAMRSLGRFWKERSEEEKSEFVALYTSLFKYMYMKNSFAFDVEEIDFLKEWQRGRYAKVYTKNILKTGDNISVDFLMIVNSGEWNIYDVVVEGLSIVNSLRGQFYSFLAKQSYDELVEKLRIVANDKNNNNQSFRQLNMSKEILFCFIGTG